MKKLTKSLLAVLVAFVLSAVLAVSVLAADVGRVTGVKASAISNNSVVITWNKIAAADGYRLQVRENTGAWVTLSDTLETNAYVVKNLKLGSTYSFRVSAYDVVEIKILGVVISSEKDHANYSTVVSVSNSIGKVTGLKATTAAPTKVKLTWSKVNGANGYLIEKKVDGKWKSVKSVTTLSHTVSGLKVGSTTSFRVKAYANVDGKKVYGSVSSTVKGTAKVPDMSGFAVNVKDTTSVVLSWNKKSSVTGYQVYRKAGSGDWKKIKTITKNSTVSFTNNNLTLGTKYQYKVRAYYKTDSKTYYGAFTSAKSITPTLPAVVGIQLNTFVTKNRATITWDKISGAKSYQIYDYSSGKGVKLTEVTLNKATISVEDNSIYQLKIRATVKSSSGNTVNGVFSDVYELYTTPAAVKNLSYEALPDGTGKFMWDKISTAHGYKIEVLSNNVWNIYTVCADNYHIISDPAQLPGSNFRVSAFVRNDGISLYGGISSVTAKVIQRPELNIKDSTQESVILEWSHISNADYYIIEKYNFNEDKWVEIQPETYETQYTIKVPEESAAISGLYRVYAYNKDYNAKSSASEEVIAYSEGISISQDGASQTLMWPAVDGAAKYRVYVKNLYGDRSYLGSIIPASTNSATITLTPNSLQALVIHAYAANGDYLDCVIDELIIKTDKLQILDKNHIHYNHSVNSQILYLVDAINKTKHEAGEVTVASGSVVQYETEKLIVNNTSFNGTNIDGLLRFINSLTGLNKDSDDVKGLTLSGKETSSETITFDNCIGRNEQGKSVNLATYIDPSDEECAYLYSSGDPAAWKNGVKSITITPTNNGGNKVVLVLYKEEYGTETNSSEANYHRGFATTIASLGQFTSGTRIENQLTSVGDTTITAVINANGTLDSYQVSSPYTMKMKSPVNGLVGINSFGMQIKGNLTSAYTFTR